MLASVSQAAGQVLRGGSFNNNQNNAAASYRNNNNPNNRNNNNGFRVVVAAHNLLTLQKTMHNIVCSQKWRVSTDVRLRRRRKDSAGGSGLHAK
ncbi:hypothetical protein FBR02_11435 [Anaerolineae bacterium CFX9]|nr:hypothetical protein [Anaerolineae bacterium CFX9]